METKAHPEDTLANNNIEESYEKPQIKAIDMSCSQRPDWKCGPCKVFAKDLIEEQS